MPILHQRAAPRYFAPMLTSDNARPAPPAASVEAFIARWSAASPSERAHSQLFLSELCDVLGTSWPAPRPDSGYAFEHPATEHHPDGTTTQGRIDLSRRASAYRSQVGRCQNQRHRGRVHVNDT